MNFSTIPCCYFPTTIVAIDDDAEFLKLLKFKLGKNMPCKTFSSPTKALDYLMFEYREQNLMDRCVTLVEEYDEEDFNMNINVESIHQQIYNEQRFGQITVVLVDYAMAEMNGSEVCKKLKNYPFKIILLTGEAGEKTAIEQFNDGLIHRYIRKSDFDYLDLLKSTIQDLQLAYFLQQSDMIVKTISKKAEIFEGYFPPCLNDPVFMEFFSAFLDFKNIVEFYLLEENGSFLLLNEKGDFSWLLIKNEGHMEAAIDNAMFEGTKMPPSIKKSVLDREVIIHFFNNDFEIENSSDWASVVYPAIKIVGKNNYYYSWVEKPQMTHHISPRRILTYNSYLDNLASKIQQWAIV